jgi:hypothetical protein
VSMVAPPQRIASAFVVWFGNYGDVTRAAQQRGVCRQSIYREAATVLSALQGTAQQQEITRLRQRVQELEQCCCQLQDCLAQAVILDQDKQAEFATVSQGIGVSLPDARTLMEVLLPGKIPSVATLGRWTQAAGQAAAPLLAVLDAYARPAIQQAGTDEIYVSQPVLMVVEPESMYWVTGRRLEEPVTGAAWTKELGQLPALEQVTRDAGSCLKRGVAELNRQRHEQGLAPVADQLDHFHLLREGGRVVGRSERAARRAYAAWEAAEAQLAERERQGQSRSGCTNRIRACLAKAERALDVWTQRERTWRQVKAALQPFTPEGELNTRARAEAILAEVLPHLPDAEFASFKRQVQQPDTLRYLDEIQRKLGALDLPAELQEAALDQEGLRRRPELLQGETAQAAARRGVILACTVILAGAGALGQATVKAVRRVLRNSWRASSLVECVNSVVRMHQGRHRKVSQGLLNLKRLYWNCHVFRTGRRRGQSPYQRLGLIWPEGLRWWQLLKWSPERLRAELSALNKPV